MTAREPLSQAARDARKPLQVAVLLGARDDIVPKRIGRGRAAKTLRRAARDNVAR